MVEDRVVRVKSDLNRTVRWVGVVTIRPSVTNDLEGRVNKVKTHLSRRPMSEDYRALCESTVLRRVLGWVKTVPVGPPVVDDLGGRVSRVEIHSSRPSTSKDNGTLCGSLVSWYTGVDGSSDQRSTSYTRSRRAGRQDENNLSRPPVSENDGTFVGRPSRLLG